MIVAKMNHSRLWRCNRYPRGWGAPQSTPEACVPQLSRGIIAVPIKFN